MNEGGKSLAAAAGVSFVETGSARATRHSPIVESVGASRSVIGEELRLLRARVRKLSEGRGVRCLALTSALPHEGKSTISIGLAAAVAREPGKRVLLVEADVRRPTISDSLGLPGATGLAEWLNHAPAPVPVRRVVPGGFSLLVAGRAPLERPESLGSPQMEALLQAAREAFDFVLLDATPVLPMADTILLQDLVDGFLFVVRSRSTPRDAIIEALGRLRPDKIMGLVLNDHQEYRHSYRSYAYERYGMSHDAVPAGERGPRLPPRKKA